MRCVFKPTIAAAVTGLFIAASVPVLAQSEGPGAPVSGSSDNATLSEGSGTRAEEAPGGSGTRVEQAPIALEGYCPVSVLAMRKWVKGDPAHEAVYDGRTYLFANPEGRKMFLDNPAKYVPALGGDCVVALVKMDKRVPGNIRNATIHDGRLFLFSNANAHKMFLADPATYADADLARGGNCPVCAAGGHDMPGKPEIAAFHAGLRYLFPSAEMRGEFSANPEKYVSAAGSGTKLNSGSSTKQPSSGSATKEPAGSGSSSR